MQQYKLTETYVYYVDGESEGDVRDKFEYDGVTWDCDEATLEVELA